MSVEALEDLRARLQSDTGLSDFFVSECNRDAVHLIGYKRTQNAADYPFVCYVEPQADIGEPGGERLIASVVIGVNAAGVTNGIYDGVRLASLAARLVIVALGNGSISDRLAWAGRARMVTDVGARHPFYEIEIILPLVWLDETLLNE